jgi:protein-tyrosine-phosphatase/DNA-binding transcriptional ArsR family regulator
MTATSPPDFLKLLAHDLRWQILQLLAQSDRRVQELVALIGRPMNLVSYHLRLLRNAGLVEEHRSAADGRDLYYALTLTHLSRHFHNAGQQLHPALGCNAATPPSPNAASVLFLCTRNSARSQMAEALLRAQSGTRPIRVASAGTQPATVDPDAIRAMARMGIDIASHTSKHLDRFRSEHFDHVITVCDQARENCPTFPGEPNVIHWSIPDPVLAGGTDEEERLAVFVQTAHALATRVSYWLMRLDGEAIALKI